MATIKDVARRAGVAPSTVSYALSGKRSISMKARKKIAAVIDELDFTPSVLGRRLVHGRSNMIGLAYPVRDAELAFEPLEFLPIAASLLHKHGFGLSLFTGAMTPGHILDLYRNNTVDGLLLMGINRQDPRVEILRDKGFPLTLIGRCHDMTGFTSVDYDAEQAVFALFEHLHALGHRTIGYLDFTDQVHHDKFGYAWLLRRGLRRAQKAFTPTLVCEETTDTVDGSYAATCALLKREPRLTAIITVARLTPIGVLRALQEAGRRVPDDCSVVGITTDALAKLSMPQLTSADIPLNDMVRVGVELVLAQLSGDDAATDPRQVIFPAKVIDRASTGLATGRRPTIELPV